MIIYTGDTDYPNKTVYFDNETHVINYSVTFSEKLIILTSDKAPNTPVFRLTYSSLDKETINTKFEMSMDREKLITYIKVKSKKEIIKNTH
jgi:hypothetical protein